MRISLGEREKKNNNNNLEREREVWWKNERLLFGKWLRYIWWCKGSFIFNGMLESRELCLWLEMVGWWSKNHGPQFERPDLSVLGSHLSIFGHFSIGQSWLYAMRWKSLYGLISVVGS